MVDVIPEHLLIKNEKIEKDHNYYKYGYNVNHKKRKISKIFKMAAFWRLI